MGDCWGSSAHGSQVALTSENSTQRGRDQKRRIWVAGGVVRACAPDSGTASVQDTGVRARANRPALTWRLGRVGVVLGDGMAPRLDTVRWGSSAVLRHRYRRSWPAVSYEDDGG